MYLDFIEVPFFSCNMMLNNIITYRSPSLNCYFARGWDFAKDEPLGDLADLWGVLSIRKGVFLAFLVSDQALRESKHIEDYIKNRIKNRPEFDIN